MAACLAALTATEAFGLNRRLAFGRDGDFDYFSHQVCSISRIRRWSRAIRSVIFSNEWKALFNFAVQLVSDCCSRSSCERNRGNRTDVTVGAGLGGRITRRRDAVMWVPSFGVKPGRQANNCNGCLPGHGDLHTDRTVRQLLFADRMALLTGFEFGSLDRVRLKEGIQI